MNYFIYYKLGGRDAEALRPEVERLFALVRADFGVQESLDELVRLVGGAVDEGFRRVKLKFRPGWDVAMLSAVRKQHPDHVFHIDCNSGYRLSDTNLFREVDRFQLAMIEQPLQHDDLIDHAVLQGLASTPKLQ